MTKQPEQFTPADTVRKELDAKIDQKVSYHVFYWAFGILVLVITSMIGFMLKIDDSQNKNKLKLVSVENKSKQMEAIANKIEGINNRILRIEIKSELSDKR